MCLSTWYVLDSFQYVCCTSFATDLHTFHIMAHYTTHERDMQMPKMKAALTQFIVTHMDWIQSVASDYIKAKQVPLELYLKCQCNLDRKLDELRILIISRCFHVHTLILINGSYWTSHLENDYKNTFVKLAFYGMGIYKELYPVAEEDSADVNTVINKVDILQKGCDEKDLHGTGLLSESETAQPEDIGNESEGDKNYFVVNGVRYKESKRIMMRLKNRNFWI